MDKPTPKFLTTWSFILIFSSTAIACIAVVLYITPHIVWDIEYDVPLFVMQVTEYFRVNHNVTGWLVVLATILPFVIVAIMCSWIAKYLTDNIDHIEAIKQEEIEIDYAHHYLSEHASKQQRTEQEIVEGEVILTETEPYNIPWKMTRKQSLELFFKLTLLIAVILLLLYLAETFIVIDMLVKP